MLSLPLFQLLALCVLCPVWLLSGSNAIKLFASIMSNSINNIASTCPGLSFKPLTPVLSVMTGWFERYRFRYHIFQYTPCSPGSVLGNIALGSVFLDALPRANIKNTSSCGKHWQCSNNAAERHNVDFCRQRKNAITLVLLMRQNLNNRNKISYKKFWYKNYSV